jgi:hypothetical protein
MEAGTQKDIHFILGLIAGLCQFEDRNEFMLAVLVEDLQAQEEIAAMLSADPEWPFQRKERSPGSVRLTLCRCACSCSAS